MLLGINPILPSVANAFLYPYPASTFSELTHSVLDFYSFIKIKNQFFHLLKYNHNFGITYLQIFIISLD